MNASAPLTRHFSVEDANRTLPLVRLVVRDIVEIHAEVKRRREQLLDASRRTDRESIDEMENDLDADLVRLQECVDELVEIGVELKDPATGLVDFPTVINHRAACLCWKLGEDAVGFWHDVESGFAGRQPIQDDLTATEE